MRKSILFIIAAVCCMAASAAVPERKMLEQGKLWINTYHHVEDRATSEVEGDYYDEPMWQVYYQLIGDTVIDERQYMKMYRWDDRNREKKYYGAFREDEEGRVFIRSEYYGEEDFKIVDFNMDIDYEEYDIEQPINTIVEIIKENGKQFHRYRYEITGPDGSVHNLCVGIEGVGFQEVGIVRDVLEPKVPCICDYEELAYVHAKDFFFDASAFFAPKEIELTDDEKQLTVSNNDFAFNLFRKARGEESIVLSPLSITYALGLLNNGAAGKTQEEINQTLGFGEAGADAINAFCQKMLKEAETLDEKTKSLIANTIFVNEGLGYRLQDGFIQKANDYYDAQPQNRNFNDGETLDVINQWASDHTMGMIKEVLNEDTFNPYAVSYLLNAIYFKGSWSSPFDKAETKDEPFGGGETVPMMHKPYTYYEYAENDLYQAINLPYGNGAYRMSIFLPREGKTISDVLDALSGSKWEVNGSQYQVDLKLPRFETDTNQDLVDIMSALGMPTAFDKDNAEFPYFCNASIFIGMMKQVAKIKLDEEGTEAAAVTIIGEYTSGMPKQAEFHANRPFLYVISEQSTGAIFFIGQYMGKVATGIVSPRIQKSTDEGAIYNLAGQKVDASYKGLVIQNGKKKLIK